MPPEPTDAIGKAVMHGVPTDYLDKRLAALQSVADVVAAPTTSWTVEGAMDVHITHALASKFHGVQRLMRLYGASPETTLVFGDSDNDLPMLAAVDRYGRVGMGNATPGVRAAAEHIVPALAEDGVASGLQRLVLR
ncbi:HAD-IIB family hydrolase [Candidatus Saccharibacteria bacterium]|nr:HAD-IIB family hydrolase [Candidatus Saccharibacteria bacterium]